MSDRLAEIKARQDCATVGDPHDLLMHDLADISWLIAEVERLTAERDEFAANYFEIAKAALDGDTAVAALLAAHAADPNAGKSA